MRVLECLERSWCRAMHPDPRWPIHGHYICPACGRVYPVPWQEGDEFLHSMAASPNVSDNNERAVLLEFRRLTGDATPRS
jgi:hypothetical protein